MDAKYKICHQNCMVGTAFVTKEGLYYRIDCSCTKTNNEIWRICVHSKNNKVCLGVCVPDGGKFVIHKRIPVKCLGEEPFQFYIQNGDKDNNWIPLCPDAPVRNMTQWERARFAYRNEKPGLLIQSSVTEI